ncbi:MAG TPA: molybdopterin converting factor subunit 1 [Phototrophicaceae bacterium]|nr:molybdopterin converting factor subunit 1 [Phototrophicaceae bacterium]
MQVSVLLFATLKDVAGKPRLTLALPGEQATVAEVRHALAEQFPAITAYLDSAIAAVNEEYAFASDVVKGGDKVAFFPPVSGGDGETDQPEIFRLADAPFSTDELVAAITTPATGAVCVFSGMVRGETKRADDQHQTDRLEYEAYEPMALAKMRQVADEIRERWPLVQGIAIVQRVGVLEVGQNTIVIACSSGHRDQGCFEAARYGIDRLKEIVPVWKKEVHADGSAWVEGHYLPQPQDRAR